ncbi:LuxR family transcriptional regulator [Seonamhaeicola algicola]|uniref:LuxR family transcriptional regulator n=1 Tax=Seonamhaeicola algicola TaxID=1719036 RepID=A0A5C7ABI8_9FLAO|nr:LuxR C-terminal-related transcriptional regulator [Seonamhaeicola algicola]TXE06170.1 LuxR family transcriptional regulator [Seonamhaeicola algicola]
MDIKEIREVYKQVFVSYDNPSLEKHINKIIELDEYWPYSSTFFCLTNTQDLSFGYVSKNMTACLGLDKEDFYKGGMKYFWSRIHPDDLEPWLAALNDLMVFTLDSIDEPDRKKMNYTWNYRLKNGNNQYVNVIQNTTPLELDSHLKPIIGLAHYTVLESAIKMDITATAKLLNCKNEYETKYFNNLSQKLLTDSISNRERDVIRLLVLSKTSKEISAKLNISSHTVDTHRRNILKKLKLSSTGELIALVKANKIII